jgi:hypothetical protein
MGHRLRNTRGQVVIPLISAESAKEKEKVLLPSGVSKSAAHSVYY